MTTSDAIDLNTPTTLADILTRAGVPRGLPPEAILITYAGCGSHGVELSWTEPAPELPRFGPVVTPDRAGGPGATISQ